MKKLMPSVIIVVALALMACSKARLIGQGAQTYSSGTPRKEQVASPLTQVEENDLKKLLSLALLSMKTWNTRTDTGCPELDGKQFNLAQEIEKREGDEIEIRLDVRENSLVVYLDLFRLYLVFPRLHDRGLAPPIDRQFCERTYEDSVATQKQYAYFERSKKTVRGDPGMTAIVDRINERYPLADYDKTTREENRKYRVPTLNTEKVESYDTWSSEKKRLYERILEIVNKEACLGLNRPANSPVSVIIPDFQVGDPDIHLWFKGSSVQHSSIEWITFSRDVTSGEYTAEPAKNLGLADEIKPLVPLINARQVKQVTVTCQPK